MGFFIVFNLILFYFFNGILVFSWFDFIFFSAQNMSSNLYHYFTDSDVIEVFLLVISL